MKWVWTTDEANPSVTVVALLDDNERALAISDWNRCDFGSRRDMMDCINSWQERMEKEYGFN